MQFNTTKIEWQWIVQNEDIGHGVRREFPQDTTLLCPELQIEKQQISKLDLFLYDQHLSTQFFVLWNPTADHDTLSVLRNAFEAESKGVHIVGVRDDTRSKRGKGRSVPDKVTCDLIHGGDVQAAAAAVSISYWNGTETKASRHSIFIGDELYRYEVRFEDGKWAARVADSNWRS
ncbi:MAG: hypothetical protein ACI97A_002909 [Planctomycetota bacterium]|jgi:hypothetical protein